MCKSIGAVFHQVCSGVSKNVASNPIGVVPCSIRNLLGEVLNSTEGQRRREHTRQFKTFKWFKINPHPTRKRIIGTFDETAFRNLSIRVSASEPLRYSAIGPYRRIDYTRCNGIRRSHCSRHVIDCPDSVDVYQAAKLAINGKVIIYAKSYSIIIMT